MSKGFGEAKWRTFLGGGGGGGKFGSLVFLLVFIFMERCSGFMRGVVVS